MEQTYCQLQWPIEEVPDCKGCDLSLASFDEVRTKLLEFLPTDKQSSTGPVVCLTHRSGQLLLVGISRVGWTLEICNPQYGRYGSQSIYSLRGLDENLEIGFNDPYYTDYPNTLLHDQDYALKMINRWLDIGHLPLFFVPNRDLGFGIQS